MAASTLSKLTADFKNLQSRAAAWGMEKSGKATTPMPEHIQAACKRLHSTIAELTDLHQQILATEKLNKERAKLQFSTIQAIGKLGSHSKASAEATHVVGTFVTTNMGGVARTEALIKSHNELLVIPLTTLLEMDVQQALLAEKHYKGALAAYDVAAFDMADSFKKQAAADEKEVSPPPEGAQVSTATAIKNHTNAHLLAQAKQSLADSAKAKATFEKKLEDLCALVDAKKNHFLQENVFRYMLQERNYLRDSLEAYVESINDSGLKESPEGREFSAPAEPASPVSEHKDPEEGEEEEAHAAADSPRQLHTVHLDDSSAQPDNAAGSGAVEVHLS